MSGGTSPPATSPLTLTCHAVGSRAASGDLCCLGAAPACPQMLRSGFFPLASPVWGGKRTDSSRGSGSLLVEGVAVFVSGACCVGGGSTLSLPARRDDRAVSPRASLAKSGMPANASAVGMVVKLGTVGRGGGGGGG